MKLELTIKDATQKAVLDYCFFEMKANQFGQEQLTEKVIPRGDMKKAMSISEKLFKGGKGNRFSDEEVVIKDIEEVAFLKRLFEEKKGFPKSLIKAASELEDMFNSGKDDKKEA